MLTGRLVWKQALSAAVGLLIAALLIVIPLWRHRVLIHRPPFAVYFALHDIIAYTSDYVTVLLLVVGWGSLLLGGRVEGRLYLGPWFVFLPLCLLVALTALSTIWALDPVYAGYQSVRFLLWMGVYLLLANLAVPVTWLTGGVVLSILLQSAVGLGQFFAGRSLGLRRWGELPLNPEWSGVSVVFTDSGRHLRAYGLTQHPNLLGGLMAVLLLLLVGLAVQRSRTLRAFSFGAVVAAFALGTATLLMTFSRGAWLAAMAGGATIVALLARSPRMTWSEIARSLMPLMVIVVAVGAVFVVTQWELLRPRLGLTYQGGEVRSVGERETLIAGARALRQLRPWLGVGAGGFSTALYQMAPQAIADYPIFQPVHRVPLLVAAELGPLGSLVWVVVMLAPLGAILVSPRRVAVDGWLAALTAVPVSLFAVGWVEAYPWSSQQGALVTWVVLGLWARHYHSLTS